MTGILLLILMFSHPIDEGEWNRRADRDFYVDAKYCLAEVYELPAQSAELEHGQFNQCMRSLGWRKVGN